MTYRQVLCDSETILMNNSYLIERFSILDHSLIAFANERNSLKTMLDSQGELTLWYTGEEIIVFDFYKNRAVWSEKVKCDKTGMPQYKTYYCQGMISPRQTKVCYRTEERGYVIVDLASATKVLIENSDWHPFFSPDDKYFSVGGRFYECETGAEIENPFSFEIEQDLNFYCTCKVKSRGSLIAIQQGKYRKAPLEIWHYSKRELLARIDDELILKTVEFEFTKSNLILHTDYGAVCIYNCRT